jgi:hypothetical protein
MLVTPRFYSDALDAPPTASTQTLSHFRSPDEDFSRLQSQYADHLVEQPPVSFRSETLTADDVLEANRNAPDPRGHIQEPDYKIYAYESDIPLFSTYKREVQARDYWTPQPLWPGWDSTVPVDSIGLTDEFAKHSPGSGDSRITENAGFGDSVRVVDPSEGTSAHQTHPTMSNHRQYHRCHEVLDEPKVLPSPFSEAQPRHPCAECVFAGKGAEVIRAKGHRLLSSILTLLFISVMGVHAVDASGSSEKPVVAKSIYGVSKLIRLC